MPTASNRPNSPAGKSGADVASNETPVASAENPAPTARKDGNTPATRPHPSGVAPSPDARTGNPDDHTNATGHDHPSQTEHAHRAFEKLNGESAKRANTPLPGRNKAGFDVKAMRKPSKMGSGIKGR